MLPVLAENQGKCLERTIMGQSFLRPIPGCVEQNRAQLKRSVVGNTEFPICRDISRGGVFEVAIDDCEQVADLSSAGFVWTPASRS